MRAESDYRAMVRAMLRAVDPYPLALESLIVDMMGAVAIEQQQQDASLIREAIEEYGQLGVEQTLRLADVVENHYRDRHGQTKIEIRPEE